MELITNNSMSMTSFEISELSGIRHDNVKRTIGSLIEAGIIEFPQIEENPVSPDGGRRGTHYVFSGEKGKRDSIVVIARVSAPATALIVDRWRELEIKNAKSPLERLAEFTLELFNNHEDRITALERKALVEDRYMSVLAFATAKGIKLSSSEASAMGKRAAAMSRVKGVPIKPIPDDRFGSVNSYAPEILGEIMA